MNIDVNKADGTLIIKIEGRVDTVTAPQFEACATENIPGNEKIVVDCEKLDYISSAGLRVFLRAQKMVNAEGSEMALKNVNETVRQIFEVTGFDTILTFE